MQNFGRGMWRRVGDYQRIQSPQIVRDNQIQQLQQYLAIAEQQKYYTYKQQSTQINNTNNITPKTELKNLETLKKGDYSVLEKIVEEPVVNEALEELAVNEAFEEPPKVVEPKKTKKKPKKETI